MTTTSEVLVLSGAAGAGKSTACVAVAGRVPGACAIDGDTLSSARRPWDYDEYWAFTMRVCADVLRNSLPYNSAALYYRKPSARSGTVCASDLSRNDHARSLHR
jgi:hypothetical protein